MNEEQDDPTLNSELDGSETDMDVQGDADPADETTQVEDNPDQDNATLDNLDIDQANIEQHESSPDLLNNQEVIEELRNLKNLFESKLRYDQHKDQTIDKLHEELQEYKEDLVLQLLKPLITDVILSIERLRKWASALKKKYDQNEALGDVDVCKDVIHNLIKQIGELPEDWEEILDRQGVDIYRDEAGEVFNGKRQKVLTTLFTEEEKQDRTIAKIATPGYQWRGVVLRPEQVEVYKYKKINNENNEH